MATVRRQFVHPAHDQLPFFAMGLNAFAKQLVGNQVRHFMGHRLFQEMLAVFTVQLGVEAQQVLVQMRDTGLLAPQLEADLGAFEASFEKGFGLQETIFDAGIELLGHAVPISRGAQYAATPSVSEWFRRRMVMHNAQSHLAVALLTV
jgi:hypothetical protein